MSPRSRAQACNAAAPHGQEHYGSGVRVLRANKSPLTDELSSYGVATETLLARLSQASGLPKADATLSKGNVDRAC